MKALTEVGAVVWQRRERSWNREGRQSLNFVIRHHFIIAYRDSFSPFKDLFIYTCVG